MTLARPLAILASVSLLSLAACSREAEAPAADDSAMNAPMADGSMDNAAAANAAGAAMGGVGQSFTFTGGDGAALGNVSVSDSGGALAMTVSASGMPPGTHGVHLHEKGLCDGPKFESAGAHWNPGQKKHGRDNPAGAHLGDLPNLEIKPDGSGTATLNVAGAAMASGANMLADADGTALVVHAKPDDYKTDPSGDSGDRIACAVVAAPK